MSTQLQGDNIYKVGSFHRGKLGYYEEHHSSTRWIADCMNCKREQKAGKHPLA